MKKPKVGEIWLVAGQKNHDRQSIIEIHDIDGFTFPFHYDVWMHDSNFETVEHCLELYKLEPYKDCKEYPLMKIYPDKINWIEKIGDWR